MSDFVGRLIITGNIKVESGLHIGTGAAEGIGLVDNYTIRDPLTQRPMIPGSSLKGRLRSALDQLVPQERQQIDRLFGGAPEKNGGGLTRMYVRDCHLVENEKMLERLKSLTTPYVEVKSENRIDRQSGVAEHPRQTERLPAGAVLGLELVYNLYDQAEAMEDLQNVDAARRFVEDEYLGGSGSRGYGRVVFEIKKLEWKSKDSYLGLSKSLDKETSSSKWLEDAAQLAGLKTTARV